MAAVEELFRAQLAGTASVAALVGTRIYPLQAPQTAPYPLIVYQVVSDVEHIVKPDVATLRLVRKRIQVDGYAKGNSAYAAIKSLEAAIKTAVYTFAGTGIVGARVAGSLDGLEPEEGIYRVSIDVSVTFNE